MGRDHRLFRPLGKWPPRRGTPACALIVQGLLACALVLLLGSFVHEVLYTTAVVYAFYLHERIPVDPATSRAEHGAPVRGHRLPDLTTA